MTIKKVILLTLILSCSTSYPTSNEEIRTKGIVAAGVLLTAGGTIFSVEALLASEDI